MSRPCTVCTDERRPGIDSLLVAGNESIRGMAKRLGFSQAALQRHAATHISASLTKAHEAQEIAQADDLLAQARQLLSDARQLQQQAQDDFDRKDALAAIAQQKGILELLGKLLGQLGPTSLHLHAHRHESHTHEPDDPEELAAAFLALLQAEPDALSEPMRRALVAELLDGATIDTTGETSENAASVEAAE